jgi:hypothetical protein
MFADAVDTGEAPKKSNNSTNIRRKKIEKVPRLVNWDQEEPFDEKNRRRKISWRCSL